MTETKSETRFKLKGSRRCYRSSLLLKWSLSCSTCYSGHQMQSEYLIGATYLGFWHDRTSQICNALSFGCQNGSEGSVHLSASICPNALLVESSSWIRAKRCRTSSASPMPSSSYLHHMICLFGSYACPITSAHREQTESDSGRVNVQQRGHFCRVAGRTRIARSSSHPRAWK